MSLSFSIIAFAERIPLSESGSTKTPCEDDSIKVATFINSSVLDFSLYVIISFAN